MIDYTIGNIGHFLVILSFVAVLAAAYSYARAVRAASPLTARGHALHGRVLFYLHTVAVLGVILVLFLIIYNNRFEYHYAYTHASKYLPVHYMISCFWEGQEGSFLLWIFWNCVLGLVLISTNRKWQAPLMAIFSLAQAFLVSMILGVVVFDVKIGSSPFLLLRDVISDPIFEINPDFIPEDGTGLNPLLQNYWMVIHPPVLFLGYASTLIPFAYLMAGLWTRRFADWIRPAIPWTVLSTALMAAGQLMGAYWAYETLSFGGYWSWDPVENAVYIPWIIQVASIHTMAIYRKNTFSSLRPSVILVTATFILVLYATFLTRSGILGNASVHSFTDLGLSGQLLIYLLAFLVLSVAIIAVRWKHIPGSEKEVSIYSREFWIFIGATVLGLMAFQVLIPTSFPVFNKIVEAFGGSSSLAPPADQAVFYSKFQLWGGVLVAILSGTGQYFWRKQIIPGEVWSLFSIPIIVTLMVSALLIVLADIHVFSYIILLTSAVYAIVTNGSIIFSLVRKKSFRLSGGAVTHVGVALMLIGILFSAGYSRVVSLNRTGMVYSRDMSDDLNMENVLLFVNEPRSMNEYELIFKGRRLEVEGVPGYVRKSKLQKTEDPHIMVAKEDHEAQGRKWFSKGDTVSILPENTYYEVEYRKEGQSAFTLYPRAQVNPNMGLIVSPDIRRTVTSDLYTHISSIPNPDSPPEWKDTVVTETGLGERFFINDYVAQLTSVHRVMDVGNIPVGQGDVAVKAHVEILGEAKNYTAEPLFIIQEKRVGSIPDYIEDLGVSISFTNIMPEENRFEFTVLSAQKDYIIMKAIEMPWINALWLGTLVLMIGLSISVARRYREFSRSASR
jgi:cytochrome c-type biogenesis protein CcmF